MSSEVDIRRMLGEVAEASAGLVRFGDSLVTGSASYEAEAAEEERSLVVTLSTGDRDRHGDVLDPAGVELGNFRRNPVVLFSHRHDLPAVGKALWVRSLPGRIVAKVAFARTQLGEELYLLYSRGYMKAWSVGFTPVEWERIDGEKRGVRVTRWELLEVSAVPVPANPEALSAAIAGGEVTEPVLVKSLGAVDPVDNGEDHAIAGVSASEGGELLGAFLLEMTAMKRKLAELEKKADVPGELPPEEFLGAVAKAAANVFDRKIRSITGRL